MKIGKYIVGLFVTMAIVATVSTCSKTQKAQAKTLERQVNSVKVYDYTDSLANCITAFPFLPLVDNKNIHGICKGNEYKNYAILYDVANKTPMVSIQRLYGRFGSVERKNNFHEEPTLTEDMRASISDFKSVSAVYDKGHLTPAGDIPFIEDKQKASEAMRDTFTLANMTPQVSEMNRGVWGKVVEESTRKYVMRVPNNKVFVYTGISGQVGKLSNGTIIPSFIWKLVYDQTDNRAWAYWMSNSKDATIEQYPLITASQLEQNLKNNGGLIDFRLPKNVGFIAK